MEDTFRVRHEFSRDDGAFNYLKWRIFVQQISLEVDRKIEVLIPFGFELTNDTSYLYKNLKRFYIYIGYSSKPDDNISYKQQVAVLLNLKLKSSYPLFYSTLYEIDIQEEKIKLEGKSSKVVVYERQVSDRLVLNWARYLLSTSSNMRRGVLPDIKEFDSNRVSRSYIFQLSIIYNTLFEFSCLTEEGFKKVHHLSTPYRNEKNSLIENISYCRHTYDWYVVPQIRSIEEYLLKDDRILNILSLCVQDYHSSCILCFRISSKKLVQYEKKIETLYKNYGSALFKEEKVFENLLLTINDNADEIYSYASIIRHANRILSIAKILSQFSPDSILDIGCGFCYLNSALEMILPNPYKYIGIDINQRIAHLPQKGINKSNAVSLIYNVNLTDFNYFNISAKVVTAIELIEHLEEAEIDYLVQMIFGGIKPQKVIISTPNYEFTKKILMLSDDKRRNIGHKFEWTLKKFELFCSGVSSVFGYTYSIETINTDYKIPFTLVVVFSKIGM